MDFPDIQQFLGCATPQAWVDAALADQDILLIDHKNCEFKAASTALSLMAKYSAHTEITEAMPRLAREELVHYEQVQRLMQPLEPRICHHTETIIRQIVTRF